MNEPVRLRDTAGAARMLLRAGKLMVPQGSRQRALAFTGVAASAVTTGTASAAVVGATLAKSVVLCVGLGAAGGWALSLAVSETFSSLEMRPTSAQAGVPRQLPPARTTASAAAPNEASASEVPPADLLETMPDRSGARRAPPSGSSLAAEGRRAPLATPASPASGRSQLSPSLFDEQRVIEAARSAAARGDAAGALRTLDGYERAYAQRQFGPEALALRIEALASIGEGVRARSLAAEFAARYPRHPLLPRVESVVNRWQAAKR